ncbi:7-methylguanosine phosphate-specific 5'-nucleotidase [Macrobrachium rosenbergii]|uniref:7-methylguanosine phosphate-specific 5'-nucleotidase n=1 Tax=Macrobrachium rosenbergii TaxID=79674 RepID=UPI0034D7657D
MIGSRGTALRVGGLQLSRVLAGSKASETSCDLTSKVSPVRKKTTGPCDTGFIHSSPAIMPETSPYPMLEKLGLLNKDHICIKDPGHVEELISTLVSDGFTKLQLVVDFDFTLTRVHVNSQRCHCSWGIMDNSSLMPAFYREEANALLAKYYPIEIDPHMTEEEKIPYMIEWYGQIHKLIVKCKVSQGSLAEMVAASNAMLRDGTEDPILAKICHPHSLCSIIFQGVMIGFKGDLIHMFNKNENAIHSSNYFDKLKGRSNVILMGDSMGDIKMAVGVPQPNNVLKIGFLNDKIEERLDTYMNAFDIVLIDDQTMDVVNSIVNLMA